MNGQRNDRQKTFRMVVYVVALKKRSQQVANFKMLAKHNATRYLGFLSFIAPRDHKVAEALN
jgi:hypothetical protein